jgi:hypothetical protein
VNVNECGIINLDDSRSMGTHCPSNKHTWSPCGNNPGYLGRVLPVRSHVGTVRAGLTQMGPCWEAAGLNHDGLAHMGTSWVPYGLSHMIQPMWDLPGAHMG